MQAVITNSKYGFAIHGCVDGFSRKLLWLKVTRSNDNPVVPASYFLETVSKGNLLPVILSPDCGNENCLMAGIQCKSTNNTDGHTYGSSISNQRIENFWSHFKRTYLPWAIDFFKDLVRSFKDLVANSLNLENIIQMEFL